MAKFRKITGYAVTTIGVVLLLAIFAMSLPIGGWRALSVQTGSMAPAIRPGALVLVHRVPESELHVGDVITYASKSSPGMTLTHRIVDLKTSGSSEQIVVKGDANNVADAPVAPSQVVGKVTTSVPVLGKVSDFTHKPLGLALLVYLPGLLIVIYELRLLVKRLTAVEVDKQKAALQAEHDKKPLSLPDDEILTQGAMPAPAVAIKQPRRVRSLDGLSIIVVLALASFFVHTTQAALNSHATLTGTTISSALITPPTPPPTNTSCTNTNSVNVTNTSTQTVTTGSTSSTNSTFGSTATSGDASNANSTNTNVAIINGC